MRSIEVMDVTFESSQVARDYVADEGIEWPILIDEERVQYRAYGMDRAGLWDIWGPSTWWAYAKAMARGGRPHLHRSDPDQRGGDVLIDPQGIVRMHWIGRGPADRPSVTAILACHDAQDAPA